MSSSDVFDQHSSISHNKPRLFKKKSIIVQAKGSTQMLEHVY